MAGAGPAARSVAGSNRQAVVPTPTSLVSLSAPPSCTASPWIIERPRPVPLPTALVEKKGSVALARVAASMPAPVSSTWSRT